MSLNEKTHATEFHPSSKQAIWPVFREWLLMVLVTWPERRRQRRHLGELQDHHLRDIGLSRKQARQETERWFFD